MNHLRMDVLRVATMVLFMLSAVVVIVIAVIALARPASTSQDSAEVAPTAETATDREPVFEQPSTDDVWRRQGYKSADGGNVYYKFADKGTYVCTYGRCTQVYLHIVGGCPSMLYAEASTLSGGVVVGMTNKVLGAIGPDADAVALLETLEDGVDAFRLTKIDCF